MPERGSPQIGQLIKLGPVWEASPTSWPKVKLSLRVADCRPTGGAAMDKVLPRCIIPRASGAERNGVTLGKQDAHASLEATCSSSHAETTSSVARLLGAISSSYVTSTYEFRCHIGVVWQKRGRTWSTLGNAAAAGVSLLYQWTTHLQRTTSGYTVIEAEDGQAGGSARQNPIARSKASARSQSASERSYSPMR